MEIKRYILKNNEKSLFFGREVASMHSIEVEWLYQAGRIGACTYPVHDANCFLRHLWSEDDIIVMRKTVGHHHARIHRKLKQGGTMGGPKYGVHQVEGLIDFIERHQTVHLYRSHFHIEEPIPNIITFDANAPNPELYTFQKVVPVEFEKGIFGKLVDKVRGR